MNKIDPCPDSFEIYCTIALGFVGVTLIVFGVALLVSFLF
jgi:hypothetical protein